jgi:hypothetical protein
MKLKQLCDPLAQSDEVLAVVLSAGLARLGWSIATLRLREAASELESRLGNLTPAMIDRK